MKLDWTITDLMHLTTNELCELNHRLLKALDDFETGSRERTYALTSLANIRRAIRLRNDLRP